MGRTSDTACGAFYNVAPCLSRPVDPYRSAREDPGRRFGSVQTGAAPARRSANCERACRASASCWRAARLQWRCRNQVAVPPANTPAIATTMRTTNSGSVMASDGSVELNGSNDNVTRCRLATANTTKNRPSGINTKALKNLRMITLAYWRPAAGPSRNYGCLDPTTAINNASSVGLGSSVIPVQPFAHFLARLGKRYSLLINRHMRAGSRIASGAGRTVLDRERPEPA